MPFSKCGHALGGHVLIRKYLEDYYEPIAAGRLNCMQLGSIV